MKDNSVYYKKSFPSRVMITINIAKFYKPEEKQGGLVLGQNEKSRFIDGTRWIGPYFITEEKEYIVISKKSLLRYIEAFNKEDSRTIEHVVDFIVKFMDSEFLKKMSKPKTKQLMKKGYVLKNDWLKYSEGVANYENLA